MKDSKQFVITNERHSNLPSGFRTKEVKYIDQIYYINYEERLNIQIVEDGCILLGNAYQCECNKKSPIEELKRAYQLNADIVETYKTWSGRWVLIWKNESHLDAGGMLGVFYMITEKSYYISSSLALIELLTGTPQRKQAALQWDKGGAWNPLPLTILESVKKLLPTQLITINGSLTIQPRLAVKKYKDKTKEELLRRIIELNISLLHNIDKQSKKTVLSLTSGVDSRTQFALLLSSGIKFSTVTYEKPRISKADISGGKK